MADPSPSGALVPKMLDMMVIPFPYRKKLTIIIIIFKGLNFGGNHMYGWVIHL